MLLRFLVLFVLIVLLIVLGPRLYRHFIQPPLPSPPPVVTIPPVRPPVLTPKPEPAPLPPAHVASLLESVMQQSRTTRSYDPRYVKLKYPGGDVPASTGVCADVIVRAFRAQGVDLQQALHEDMQRHFNQYPTRWGMKGPDTNIDHRRVYNLMRFFERKGKSLPITDDPADYKPGDVVAWDLGDGQGHIGIVTHFRTPDGRPLMGHNIAYGTNIEDALFYWPIIGHYRYFPGKGDIPDPVLNNLLQNPSGSVGSQRR